MTVAFTTRCGQNHCAVEYSVDLISAKDIAVTVQLQGKMADTGGNLTMGIEKLKDSNYATWKFQIKHLMISKGYFSIVSGTEAEPDVSADTKLKEAFQTRSEQAFALLVLAVSTEMIYLISECNSANEAWIKLEKHFERDSLSNKIFLKKKYFRSEMKEGESLTNHLKSMKQLTDRLAAIKAPISEEDQVVTLLGSLPDSFSSLVTVLEAQADLTLDGVKQSLINEEQKRDGKLGMQGNTALSVRDERRCFKCKKVGHYKHECPQIKQERSETASAAVCSVCMMASDKNGPEEEEVAF